MMTDVVFGDPMTSNRAVVRLWDRARVDALLEQIDRLGELPEPVNDVIDLSLQFGILATYTALKSDPDEDDPDGNATSVPGPHEHPVEHVTVSIAPHPAAAATTLTITVPTSLDGQPLTVTIVDILGRVLAEIARGTPRAGTTHVSLRQRSIAPGSYRHGCCGWSPLVRNSCHEYEITSCAACLPHGHHASIR